MKNREIFVDDDLMDKAKYIACGRVNSKSKNVLLKWEYNWFGSPYEHHLIGVIGELCFAKIYYGYAYTDETARPNGDCQDFISKNGKLTIDVKTSTWIGKDVHLKVTVRELNKKPKDAYVLMQYNKNQRICRYIGFAKREQLLASYQTSYGHDMVHALKIEELIN